MASGFGFNELILNVLIKVGGFINKDGSVTDQPKIDTSSGNTGQTNAGGEKSNFDKLFDVLKDRAKTAVDDDHIAGTFGTAGGQANRAAGSLLKFTKDMMGIVSDIYEEVKSRSPLLKTFESLFNLAVQLFFLPLGNAIGELLIPAVIDMVEDITNMWDSFEGKSLGQILDIMIEKGVQMMSKFLSKIISALGDQGNIFTAVANTLKSVVQILENGAIVNIIKITRGIVEFVASNLGLLLAGFIEFKTLYYSFELTKKILNLTRGTLGGLELIPGVGLLAAGSAIAIEVGTQVQPHAEGGYVNSPQLALLGEGGEGEWIVPDSKVSDFISSQSATRNISSSSFRNTGGNYTINVYGYTDRELAGIIEDKVNELSNRSRLRSGF